MLQEQNPRATEAAKTLSEVIDKFDHSNKTGANIIALITLKPDLTDASQTLQGL